MTEHNQPKTDPNTEVSVEEFFARFACAWKDNDGTEVGSFFVEDGILINPFGQPAHGRSAITAMYSEYFGGMLQGTSTTFNSTHVRSVESDHAFTDCEQTISASSGEVVLAVHLAALLRRAGGTWRFVDARPYTFDPIPA
jgi:uncharacterized protein (TIGR02246 family)